MRIQVEIADLALASKRLLPGHSAEVLRAGPLALVLTRLAGRDAAARQG